MLRAAAKLNLCLYLGARRDDGLHELRSLFCSLSLADRIVVADAGGDADEVVCAGVEGPNLVATALEVLRARGWDHPPVRVEIEKRIPVAAGLGGGSADAAAVLRHLAGERSDLAAIAAGLGADVPSQIDPALALVAGAGERVEPLPAARRVRGGADPAAAGAENGGGVRGGRPPRPRPRRRRARGDRRPAARHRRRGAPRRCATRSCSSTTSSRRRCRCARRSPRRWRRSRRSGPRLALVTGSGPTAFGLFEDIVAADRAARPAAAVRQRHRQPAP